MPGDCYFRACMLLGGVGDAIAYNDGKWEFCSSGDKIQREVRCLGGVSALRPSARSMIVSDDTVMHIATAEAILSESLSPEEMYCSLAEQYKQCMRDMKGRAPGLTCMQTLPKLRPLRKEYTTPFNPRGGGCGAAMRAVPIGLLYWRPKEVGILVRVAIEAGRMTHNHPTGFLGSVAVALFVSYAVQGREVREWGEGLLQTLSTAKQYCEQQKRDWESIRDSWSYFEDRWTDYVRHTMLSMDINLNPADYDTFVESVSYSGTGGASGHDAPMIAYDAILRSYNVLDPPSRWETLCRYGMFHGGDSDSTGIIAGACYGAMFGMQGVPPNNYTQLEYRDRLEKLGSQLHYRSLSAGRLDCYSFILEGAYRGDKSWDSFRDFPHRKRSACKKKVTFEDEATDLIPERSLCYSVPEAKPDLFTLNSMETNRHRTRDRRIPDSISQRRSHSYSPPRGSGISNHLILDSIEKAYRLEMANIDNYSPFTTATTTTTTMPRNLQNKISHSKYIPKKSHKDITQYSKSLSQPTTSPTNSFIKQSDTTRKEIHYPPNYTHIPRLLYKSQNICPNPVAHSYGATASSVKFLY